MLRVFNHYVSGRKAALFFVEAWGIAIACAGGAAAVGAMMAKAGGRLALPASRPLLLVVVAGFVVALQFSLYLFDLYNLKIAEEDRTRGYRMLKAAGATAVLAGAVVTASGLKLPAGVLMGGAFGAFAGAVVVRLGLRSFVGEPARVLIVGDGVKALAAVKAIDEEGEGAFRVVGRVEPSRAGTGRELEEPLDAIAARLGADYVVMAVDEPRGAVWVEALVRCRFQGRRVYDAAGFFERVLRRVPVAHVHASELAFSDEVRVRGPRRLLKRTLDLLFALAALCLAAPLMCLIALAIKADSRGPVFYRQERVGRGGRPYLLWKFRSMRTDAEKDGAVWARANDSRVTRVGRIMRKTRMDELPQVFNVLRGEMSFVGPRPERPVFVRQLKELVPFYGLREAIKPGITGWAQIRYPYGASVEDARNKLEFDLYYVKHASLFLDLGILFHTVRHVLFGRGAR